jgi:hypothetical protein
MAAATERPLCVTCTKERGTVRCEGCSQLFCFNDLVGHRQQLDKQLDEVEVTRDIIRETITEQINDPRKHALIQQIDEWERESINKVHQTAEEIRQLLLKHTVGHVIKKEVELNKLTYLLQQSRQKNDFVETDLNRWKDELIRITEQLAKPWNVEVQQGSAPLVTKIDVDIVSKCNDLFQQFSFQN